MTELSYKQRTLLHEMASYAGVVMEIGGVWWLGRYEPLKCRVIHASTAKSFIDRGYLEPREPLEEYPYCTYNQFWCLSGKGLEAWKELNNL